MRRGRGPSGRSAILPSRSRRSNPCGPDARCGRAGPPGGKAFLSAGVGGAGAELAKLLQVIQWSSSLASGCPVRPSVRWDPGAPLSRSRRTLEAPRPDSTPFEGVEDRVDPAPRIGAELDAVAHYVSSLTSLFVVEDQPAWQPTCARGIGSAVGPSGTETPLLRRKIRGVPSKSNWAGRDRVEEGAASLARFKERIDTSQDRGSSGTGNHRLQQLRIYPQGRDAGHSNRVPRAISACWCRQRPDRLQAAPFIENLLNTGLLGRWSRQRITELHQIGVDHGLRHTWSGSDRILRVLVCQTCQSCGLSSLREPYGTAGTAYSHIKAKYRLTVRTSAH